MGALFFVTVNVLLNIIDIRYFKKNFERGQYSIWYTR